MKKILSALFISAIVFTMAAASVQAEEVYGFIYKNTHEPGGGSGSVTPKKEGISACRSFFGVVALGDCSIKRAMEDGKINSLSHYDTEVKNILGYKRVTIKAYGQ